MLVFDRFAGTLPLPQTDHSLSSAMDLNPASMHLLPTDDFSADFAAHDNPDHYSMFLLFPNNNPPIPSEDINAPMPTDVLPPHFSNPAPPAKREPEAVFPPHDLPIGLSSDVLPRESHKRKREDELLAPTPDSLLAPPPVTAPPLPSLLSCPIATLPFYPAQTTPQAKRQKTDQPPVGSPTSPETTLQTSDPSTEEKPPRAKPRSPRRKNRKSSPNGSDSESGGRKNRSLEHMQSLAQQQAPEVALTSDELMQISTMQESDEDLASSAAVYQGLLHFKQLLAHHGYKMTALTIDPLTDNEAANTQEPMDLVLKRRVRPTAFGPKPEAMLEQSTTETHSESPRKRVKNEGQEVSCAVCNKTFSDMDTLVRHFRHTHQELKPYSCPRCKGPYSSEGTLWHHIRNVHSEKPRKFRCSFCDASYDSFGAKTRHEHATHNTDKPEFVCTFDGCGRAFNFPAHLETHALQDHPGFRPFGCTECKKRFNSANGLIRHKREVHRRNRAYSCSCGTTFAKKDHLKRHLLQRHSMSYEAATAEMKKQPSPGLVHFMPPAAPAAAEAV